MFSRSFHCTVRTDAEGKFEISTPVEGSSLFAVKVTVQAKLQSPEGTSVVGVFAIEPSEPRPFRASTHEKVDLGKWHVAQGKSIAVASGSTTPARPHTDLVVEFEASV